MSPPTCKEHEVPKVAQWYNTPNAQSSSAFKSFKVSKNSVLHMKCLDPPSQIVKHYDRGLGGSQVGRRGVNVGDESLDLFGHVFQLFLGSQRILKIRWRRRKSKEPLHRFIINIVNSPRWKWWFPGQRRPLVQGGNGHEAEGALSDRQMSPKISIFPMPFPDNKFFIDAG